MRITTQMTRFSFKFRMTLGTDGYKVTGSDQLKARAVLVTTARCVRYHGWHNINKIVNTRSSVGSEHSMKLMCKS